MVLLAGAICFTIVFLIVVCTASLMGVLRHPVDDRLAQIHQPLNRFENQWVMKENDSGMVASLGQHIAPNDPAQRSESKQKLAMAGYYSDQSFYTYWGIKIVLILVSPILVYLFFFLQGVTLWKCMLFAMFAMGLGMFTPDLFLYLRKKSRHEYIFKGLPDALDLLVVCIEAGLGLDAAMKKVSDEFHLSNRVLSEELKLTCAMIGMGKPREEALRDLGERTGVMDLKSLVAVLIQADRFGTSLAQTLRVHSEDMRTRRRQRAEELAAKTTVKLIIPLVLFIFPAIFVVLGGPAVIKIIEQFINN